MLAARKANFVNARARKEKRCARMLENARKDHLIPLIHERDPSPASRLPSPVSRLPYKKKTRNRIQSN